MTFAVTGASGQLGRLVAEELLRRVAPEQVVLISRSPDKLAEFAARGAQTRVGDFDRPETLGSAFAGVDRLLVVSTDIVGARLEGQLAAVRAAVGAGVSHVLYTSVTRPEESNPAAVVPDHAATQRALRESGLGWTSLRNNLYTESQVDVVRQAAATGRLVTNAGEGGVAYVTRADCAAVAAAALATDHTDHTDGTVLDVSGPQSLTPSDLAALAARVGGRDVDVVAVDDAAYAAGLIEHAGLPQPVAELVASFGASARLGYGDVVTDVVERWTGRPATSLASLLGL